MKKFIKDGVAYTVYEICQATGSSFSENVEDLSEFGYLPYIETPKPDAPALHHVEASRELVNNVWYQTWSFVPFSEDELREVAKHDRAQQVDRIQVTISSGKVFDGDETSKARMNNAITAIRFLQSRLDAGNPVDLTAFDPTGVSNVLIDGVYKSIWILADNSVNYVTAEELEEALALSGVAQAAIWVI